MTVKPVNSITAMFWDIHNNMDYYYLMARQNLYIKKTMQLQHKFS